MKRAFFTHDKKNVFRCICYLESHLCPVLQGVRYDIQYDRPTNTENIYVQNKDFQQHVCNGHYSCRTYRYRTFIMTHFYSNDGVWGSICNKNILSIYPNDLKKDLQECVMINKLKENNIPFRLRTRSCYEYFFSDPLVEVWIDSKRLDQLYIFDKMGILGTCVGCKWHEPWHTHKFVFNYTTPCDNCTIFTPDKCPAKQMLIDGYTECESKIKCESLLHAQITKEKFKDNQLHL